MTKPTELNPQQIEDQTRRILASQSFVRSERHSRFLEYIVDHALHGKMNRLKGYTIGIDVFDRDAEFDPNVDFIVRVEAGRLRTKLREYYREEGQQDPLIIDLPKGSYVPVFYLNKTPEAPTKDAKSIEQWISQRQPVASLGVIPFINLSGDPALDYFSERAVLLARGYPLTYQVLGHYYGITGQADKAMKIISELELKAASSYISPFCFAVIHAGLGNADQCFDWLEKAYELRSRSLAWLYVPRHFCYLSSRPLILN